MQIDWARRRRYGRGGGRKMSDAEGVLRGWPADTAGYPCAGTCGREETETGAVWRQTLTNRTRRRQTTHFRQAGTDRASRLSDKS